jgi:hypothetical protein
MDWVKVDGVWKETDIVFAKVNDVWKEVDQIYANSGGSWFEGWSGGEPPVLQHTANGEFTITNYDPRKEYAVFTEAGALQAGASVSSGVVNMGNVRGNYKVSYANRPNDGTYFSRLAITYTPYQVEVCSTSGGSCSAMCSGSGSPCGNCCCWGCGPVVSGGICCCPGSTTCNWETRQRKNGVPAGYTERYGEWVKITNPVVRGIQFADVEGVVPFSSVGTWEKDYYISFETPEKTYAQVEPNQFEDGTPNPDPAKDWVFNYTIMLTFFDEVGDIYLSINSTDDPEYFVYAKGDGVNTFFPQEVDIVGIQGLQKGSWEAVWIAPAENPHTAEDINILKELVGSVG